MRDQYMDVGLLLALAMSTAPLPPRASLGGLRGVTRDFGSLL